MAKILIKNRHKAIPIELPMIRKTVSATLGALGLSKVEVSILLLDDPAIAEFNQRYLKRSGPTDVISFPMHDGSFPEVQPQLLGDIALSLETAQRQADGRGLSLQEEVTELLVHGVLHLLGYDHERSPSESRRMKTKEREVLAAIARSRQAPQQAKTSGQP